MKTESQLRRMAKAQDKSLHKSRAALSLDNQGGYRIVNSSNFIERGEKYELSLDEVEEHLMQKQQN